MATSKLEQAVNRVYDEISQNGTVTDNQLIFILLYERKMKSKGKVDNLIKDGTKVISLIDQIMGG